MESLSKTATIRTDNKDWSISSIRSTLTSTSSSSPSTPITGSTPINMTNIVNNIFNHGRRLRQRSEKNYAENSRRNSVSSSNQINIISSNGSSFNLPGSPSKISGSDISYTELQSSLFLYFGAANRISNGEKFYLRGRRLCPDGRYQYLVEWEGMS